MELTQTYAVPSAVVPRGNGLGFSFAVEEARPGVHLEATVHRSTSYSRVMRALHHVVSSNAEFAPKDHSVYQEWVQGEYLKELGPVLAERIGRIATLQKELQEVRVHLALLDERGSELNQELRKASGERFDIFLWEAKQRYWKYLHKRHRELWVILDPVVSVYPDAVIFEVFSRDESSYGCVRVPSENLETFGQTAYGTTNVDYSRALADEMARVRDYRPAFIGVGSEGVTLQTTAGTRVEKKIDLPPSWVRGFLQVQSASALATTTLRLSATTVGEVLRHLKARREKEGPRSLKFHLVPGQLPTIEIEPWGEVVREGRFVYEGHSAQEIRIWGRRRLFTFDELLPFADEVEVRLLGDGLPSFWSLALEGHRFELGLSGWTENDWSRAARFDLLASSGHSAPEEIDLAAHKLEAALLLTTQDLAKEAGWDRATATRALQTLCRQGRALFDSVRGAYRWRLLFPFAVEASEEDGKARSARRWIEAGQVGVEPVPPSEIEANEFLQRATMGTTRVLRAAVQTEGGVFRPLFALNADGRATFFQCTCADFRRDKGRGGPCGHVLAGLQALLMPELPKIEAVPEAPPRDTTLVCLFFDLTKQYASKGKEYWSEGRVEPGAGGIYVLVERSEPVGIGMSSSRQLAEELRLLSGFGIESPRIVGFRTNRFRAERLGEGWRTYDQWLREAVARIIIPDEWIWWRQGQVSVFPVSPFLRQAGDHSQQPDLLTVLQEQLEQLVPDGSMATLLRQLRDDRPVYEQLKTTWDNASQPPSTDWPEHNRYSNFFRIMSRLGIQVLPQMPAPTVLNELRQGAEEITQRTTQNLAAVQTTYPLLWLLSNPGGYRYQTDANLIWWRERISAIVDYIQLVDAARSTESTSVQSTPDEEAT